MLVFEQLQKMPLSLQSIEARPHIIDGQAPNFTKKNDTAPKATPTPIGRRRGLSPLLITSHWEIEPLLKPKYQNYLPDFSNNPGLYRFGNPSG